MAAKKKTTTKKSSSKKKSPAWQRKEGKNKSGGLNAKGRASYRKANPGSKLAAPVTEKDPKGKRAKRKKAFCSRMKGMKKKQLDRDWETGAASLLPGFAFL